MYFVISNKSSIFVDYNYQLLIINRIKVAINVLHRALWLLEIIQNNQPISRREITQMWRRDIKINPFGKDLSRSTFNGLRQQVQDTFPVRIECENNKYSLWIGNAEMVERKKKWISTSSDMLTSREQEKEAQVVRIKASKEVIEDIRERPFHLSQKEEKGEEGGIFSFRISITSADRARILSYGANIEVLSPDSFRKDVAAQAIAMAELYK